jgi:NYN domain
VRTNVYIDGWNLYYGAIKGTSYRWLDLRALSFSLLNRGCQVERVQYFTARVNDRPTDPQQSQRQDTYLRALRTIPGIEIYMGRFATRTKRVRLARQRPNGSWYDDAVVTEEKGSDVKLATHLVLDAAVQEEKMECALVISNDSDLQESIDVAMTLGVRVITCNPHDHHSQPQHLKGHETRNLRKRHLAKSQLPASIPTAGGKTIRRPARWDP